MHVASTTPYPWPYDGSFSAGGAALLVLGAQPAFVTRSHDPTVVSARLLPLVAALRPLGLLVGAVRHVGLRHRSALPPCDGSPEAAWASEVDRLDPDLRIVAGGLDAAYASPLEAQLKSAGRLKVMLAGWASELTVDSTVRTLNDRGLECLVLTDVCVPCDPDLGAHAFDSLTKSGGIFGALGETTDVLTALTALSA